MKKITWIDIVPFVIIVTVLLGVIFGEHLWIKILTVTMSVIIALFSWRYVNKQFKKNRD